MNELSATRLLATFAAIVAAGCGTVTTSPATPGTHPPSSVAALGTTPTVRPTSPFPSPVVTDPGGVAAAIATVTVPGGGPRLLPAYVPPGMSATVTARPQSYSVGYSDDLHTREVLLSVNEGANPPPVTSPNGTARYLQFRGIVASYTVYDATAPASRRYLMWPTKTPTSTGPALPDYFLFATGLTEAEFFRVGGSLQPV